jgi:hypothetical protein
VRGAPHRVLGVPRGELRQSDDRSVVRGFNSRPPTGTPATRQSA